ncbi:MULTISPECIES: vWA domain-containing protein [unclassified Pseudonocardia]|uniref:vWA domain-containing protein n=1 Tax=unclassified Pseudonocardia TaxID=2619320 RepID=UPI00201656F8|nr:vWA domain-containing protein [Pseudonocardia sp. Ae707_Ps1]
MARVIAERLTVRRRRRSARASRGSGPLVPVPFAYSSDDIDLERTMEALAGRPHPEPGDIVVRERMSSRRVVTLVVDLSGSMRGEKARIAAATVGALSAELCGPTDQLAVVAFWSDAAVIKPLDRSASPSEIMDTLLRVPARGLTNVGFGLSVARTEMARSAANRRSVVLLSDAVHNAGPDPREIARRMPELNVLLEIDGEHDLPLGSDLARMGHGLLVPVGRHRDVPPALNRVLGRGD